MVKNKINRVIIKATGPQPKAPDLEGYTRYDIPWNDGTGENLYIWMKPDGQSQDVFIGSDENLKVVTRSRDIIFKTNTAGVVSSSQAQATLRVIQTNAVYTYRLILSVDHETLTAAGGTAKVSAQLEAKIGDDIIYTKEVNPIITLQDSVPGFSLDGSNITVANRTTTIGNSRTCTILATVNAEETGEEVFATIAITQEGNYVESISLTRGNFSYDNAVASGQVINPNSTLSSPTFTFTSGSTTTVVPSVTYGTVNRSTTYSSQANEGFSAANTETGAVTVASRGSVIGNIRTSNTITRHEYYSFVPASGYDAKGQIDSELDSQATISQSANVPVSVTVVPDFTYPAGNIPASGGTKTPSIYTDITITWSSGGTSTADETGESGYTVTKTPDWSMAAANGFTLDSSTGTVTAANRGTTEGDSYTSGDITLNLTVTVNIVEEYGGGSISDEESVTKDDPIVQSANSRIQVFSKPTITEFTVEDIPAKGGTISSGTVTYHQASTWYYDSGETAEGPSYTEGGSVQFGSAITAASLGTTVKARSVVGTLTCTVSMNGQTSVEGDAVVYQQANAIVAYGDVNLNVQTPINCDVLGGSYKITPVASQVITYTSEATIAGNISLTYAQKSAMSGFTLNGQSVTVTENKSASVRNGYTVTVTATGEGNKSASKEVVFNQAAGTKSYADPVISVFTYPTIAASGGTVTPTIEYSQTWGWNDSTTDGGTITTGAALSFTGDKVTSEGSVSASTKGTTVSDVTDVDTVTLKVTLNNKSVTKAFTVQQAANVRTDAGISYSSWNVSISASDFTTTSSEAPAGGGSCTITASATRTRKHNYSYTSGATSTVSISDETATPEFTSNGMGLTVQGIAPSIAVWEDRGTEIGNRRSGTVTASYGGASDSVTLYQEANNVESYSSSNFDVRVNNWDCPASGGTCPLTSSIYRAPVYTSGAKGSSTKIDVTSSTSWEVTSGEYFGYISGDNLIVSSRGTDWDTSSHNIYVEGSYSGYTDSDYARVAANNRTKETSSVSVSISADETLLPASGGSCTLSYSASYQSRYVYDSGSHSDWETSYLTPTISGSGTGFSRSGSTVTAADRGTTTGGERSVTYTASYEGISDQVIIRQEANEITETTYSYSNIFATADDIPASGGSISSGTLHSVSCVPHYRYTSGSEDDGNKITSLDAFDVDWGTAVSAPSRGTTVGDRKSVGTLSFTVSYKYGTGSGSGSVTIYQEENIANPIDEYGDITNITLTGVLNFPGKGASYEGDIMAEETIYHYIEYTSGDIVLSDTETVELDRMNANGNISSSDSWIEAVMINTTVYMITVSANPNSSSRSGTVTVTIESDESGNSASKDFTVTQEKRGVGNYLNVSPASLSFTASGGIKSVSIDTNESWTIS